MLVSIVIPVYNEAKLIEELIARVAAVDISPYSSEIIVVNDGSTDGTSVILERLRQAYRNVSVRELPNNVGKSAALREGFTMARGEIILVQDADLEYYPEDYPLLLAPFSDSKVRVVYGSRFLKKAWPDKMMLHNWLANRLFTWLVNFLFKVRITDEGTAYKVFRADTLRGIALDSSGFAFCAEVTCKLGQRNIAIHEVPVRYSARGIREGKKPRFWDGVVIIMTILRIRLRSKA